MDSIYNRYALGLFSIAKDENKVEIYKDEIKNIDILLKENESKDVVIKSNNNVTFTFEKGTMKGVEGKENYDFSN